MKKSIMAIREDTTVTHQNTSMMEVIMAKVAVDKVLHHMWRLEHKREILLVSFDLLEFWVWVALLFKRHFLMGDACRRI